MCGDHKIYKHTCSRMNNKLLHPLVSVPTMNTRGLADAENGPATLLDPSSQAEGAGSPEASQAKGEEADGKSAAASGPSPASERLSPDNAASSQSPEAASEAASPRFLSLLKHILSKFLCMLFLFPNIFAFLFLRWRTRRD